MFSGGKDLRCGMGEHPYHMWHVCSKLTPAPYEKAQTSEEMIYMQVACMLTCPVYVGAACP